MIHFASALALHRERAKHLNVHGVLVVAGAILLSLQCVKFLGILSAIRWIMGNGEEFSTKLKSREGDFSKAVYWNLLDQVSGKTVLPLGVLEYRLFRFASRRNLLIGRIVKLAHAFIYDFTALGAYVAVYLFVAGTPAFKEGSHGSVVVIAWASAGLAVLQLIAIYAEACVSYARIGSYGLGFHGASRYVENRRAGTYFAEAKTLAGAVIYTLGIGSLVFYFSANHGARFGALTVTHSTPLGVLGDLLNCVYFAVVTFFYCRHPGCRKRASEVGYGDLSSPGCLCAGSRADDSNDLYIYRFRTGTLIRRRTIADHRQKSRPSRGLG